MIRFIPVIKKILFLFLLCAAQIWQAYAQSSDFSKVNGAVGICALVYQGDLTPNRFGDLQQANVGWQLSAYIPVSANIGVKGSFLYGRLDADDKRYDDWRPKRGFSFSSTITEISLVAQWELNGNSWEKASNGWYVQGGSLYKRIFPYIFAGIGYTNNNLSRGEMNGIDSVYFKGDVAWENYYAEKNTVYQSGMAVVPVGIGTHILLSPSLRLYVEYGYRILFNDYLDGYAKAVVSKKADAYQSLSFGFDFRFLKYHRERRSEICNLGL